MAKDKRGSDQESIVSQAEPPHNYANVPPPRELHPTSDIRFVLVELGKVGEKIESLMGKVDNLGARLGTVETTIDRVRTGLIVAGAILSIVGALFLWAIGDRITVAVRSALLDNPAVEQSIHNNKH